MADDKKLAPVEAARSRPRGQGKITQADVDYMVRNYTNGVAMRKIAADLNCAYSTVHRYLMGRVEIRPVGFHAK